ncbi:hypothetical protein GQ457_05G032890 [Hibiscus cannabinus]
MESNKFALLFLALVLAVAAPSVMAARNQVTPFSIIAVADADTDFENPLANVFFDDTRNAANSCYKRGHLCSKDRTCCSGKCLKFPRMGGGFCD